MITLRKKIEESKTWYLQRYGVLDWQWEDEGLPYAIMDYHVDENDSDRKKNSVQKAKDEFMICYLRPDIAQFLNTGWGVVNAMSDMVSHSAPRRASKSYQENNWGRIMDGHKLLDRMTSLVGVR